MFEDNFTWENGEPKTINIRNKEKNKNEYKLNGVHIEVYPGRPRGMEEIIK